MAKISSVAPMASTSALKETVKASGDSGGAFKELMKNLMESTHMEASKIEKTTKAQVMGETDFTLLTTNMLQLETMVQGMVGVRDKLVNAWQDLQKIQI